MRRRILAVTAVAVGVALLLAVLVARQLVFGGTPSIHRSASLGTPTPCVTGTLVPGGRAFAIMTQQSSAAYTAHFLAAGQTVPGTVTGETGDVSGEFLIAPDTNPAIQSLRVVVDLRKLESGSADRDNHVRNDTLEANTYPYATFVAHHTTILTGTYTAGQRISFKLPGDLTLHGVTRPATFDLQGTLEGDTITGAGTTMINIADFGMKTPQITSIVPVTVDTHIALTITFVAHREQCLSATPAA
jgi:polyisoprenoid-binding protein YceI